MVFTSFKKIYILYKKLEYKSFLLKIVSKTIFQYNKSAKPCDRINMLKVVKIKTSLLKTFKNLKN